MEGGIQTLAKKFGKEVKNAANAERNTQNCCLRTLFVTNKPSEFQMAKNVVMADMDDGIMACHANLLEEFPDVEDLRKCLLADTFRTKPNLYDLFCRGIESGKLRGTKARAPCPLSEMLTISHEANFRLELALTLSIQGYRHRYSTKAVAKRCAMFKDLIWTVKKDREDNGESAWTVRKQFLQEDGVIAAEDGGLDPEAHGGVNIDETCF